MQTIKILRPRLFRNIKHFEWSAPMLYVKNYKLSFSKQKCVLIYVRKMIVHETRTQYPI
jgi:hypothetical protein